MELRGLEASVDGAPMPTIEPARDELGVRIADPTSDAIEEALRARRIQAGDAFAGVVGIRATHETTFGAIRSVLLGAASAGYARIALQRIGDPAVLDVDVDLPLHSSPTELHLEVSVDADVRIAWRPRLAEGEAARDTRASRREIGAKICAQWGTHGAHRELDDAGRDRAILHVETGVPLRELWEVLDGVQACRREQRVRPATPLSSGLEEVAAFRLYVSFKWLPLRAAEPASP